MATREEVYEAIRNADRAGDSESVRKLGAYLQTMGEPAAQKADDGGAMGDAARAVMRLTPAGLVSSVMTPEGRQDLGNSFAGALRGAGSIGATLMYPIDKATDLIKGDRGPNITGLVTGKQPMSRNQERRAAMDEGLMMAGADTNSGMYKTAKVGTEVAGTAGTGGALANLLGRSSVIAASVPNLLKAIGTGGMSAGSASGFANPLIRALGGGITGGASTALVEPEKTGTGAVVGALAPGAVSLAGKAGEVVSDAATSAAQRLMQSALKPTIRQLKDGTAATAVQTLLDYGISPTKSGVNKLRELIDAKNSEIASEIAGSSASVDKQNVLNALTGTRQKFGAQVSPTSDLNAIQKVADDFTAHPNVPGATIPVQAAQEMKQGTYRVLRGKYGQSGIAEIEAQKDLARGLKDEIATAVPAVGPLNAEESRLLSTLSVAERRALMDANKNPMGLAALAMHPAGWAAFMADRSVAFKSLAARMLNASAPAGRIAGQGAVGMAQNPLLRSSAVLSATEASP